MSKDNSFEKVKKYKVVKTKKKLVDLEIERQMGIPSAHMKNTRGTYKK